jgi:hypothetical protein
MPSKQQVGGSSPSGHTSNPKGFDGFVGLCSAHNLGHVGTMWVLLVNGYQFRFHGSAITHNFQQGIYHRCHAQMDTRPR